MKINPTAIYGAAILGIAAAACGGGAGSIASPNAPTLPQSGGVTLSSTNQTVAAFTPIGGYAGSVIYPTGTGSATVASSALPPTGVPAIAEPDGTSSAKRAARAATALETFVYLNFTGSAALSTFPGASITFPQGITPPVTTYYLAYYNTTTSAWSTFSSTNTIVGQTVQFPPTGKPINLASGALTTVVYTGQPPVGAPPTSAPVCVAGNAVCDPGFESGNASPYGDPITTGHWTVCSINPQSMPQPHPASSFTPVAGTVPGAGIGSFVTSAQAGTFKPVPTVNSVQVHSGVFAETAGGVFSTYTYADYAYNGLCQVVTIPAASTLSMWIFGAGNENATYVDFDVDLLDQSNNFVANLYDENTESDTAFRQISADVSSYAGSTYQLFIGEWTKSGSSTGSTNYSGYYFIDDVFLGAGVPTGTTSAVRRR